ncbi:MAG: DUF2975 domain-containing protein [Eubacteriales bacterium]|nr:DUF2975 domain-containing protein [Eubacteriales bacterium]
MKFLVIFAAACGLALDLGVLPVAGMRMAGDYPEFAGFFWPWLVFLWAISLPCFSALSLAWRIFSNIEKERAFSVENADHMERISFLSAADAALLVLGNAAFLLAGGSHMSVLLASFLIALIGIGVSVAAAALSHLIRKAAQLQDQSDWTI